MNRIKHIILLTVLLVLFPVSCKRAEIYMEPVDPQLMVSLYIPSATLTRAETGNVSPLTEELKITSLQIWVFMADNGLVNDGKLITYKLFTPGDEDDPGLGESGIPYSTITRFGLPLDEDMFALLSSSSSPKVDVYAVANVASAVKNIPWEKTSRADLDKLVVDNIGGNWPLTKSVPEAGLPMSGVLKGAVVTGRYPVLNITTLKLTRAVSKIRFVFCQQGVPATASSPAIKANDACEIVGISFDGTNEGKDCQISTTERLFTTASFDLGDNPDYVALSASLEGTDGDPLIPNEKLSIVVDPEELFFRGAGNETETAENYETRLDEAVSADSQVGPIYLRETDKRISGKIKYRTTPGGDVQTTRFSMDAGDVFSRNHTWIVYACFVEETMKLRLTVVVVPWEWESYILDYTTSSINVVRRFTVFETPTPTFYKKQTDEGFYDVRFWHEIDGVDNVVEGDIIIATPVGGTLYVIPVPMPGTQLPDAILVSPATATIYPNYLDMESGRIEDCQIRITISCNKGSYTADQLKGQYIDLHFCVETPDHRFVDLGSESIDYYRFILDPDWKTYVQ